MNANRLDRANHKWWTLAAMCFALFMIMLDNTVVNVALPSIQRSLKTTPENLEWTINAYFLSFAALILLGGKLGDRFGRKRIFLVGLGIFTLASAACALSTSDSGLISARVVQGVGAALMNPLSLSIIVDAFPRHQVPTAIGIWAGISGLGLAVGPLLGGFLVEHVSWSAVFWINVPIGVVAAAATLWAVHESKDPKVRSFDIVGTLLVTAGLFSLVWALIRTNSHSWSSGQTVGFLVAAAVLLVGFVLWEDRQSDPMIPLSFFRRRSFDVAITSIALVGFSMFGIIYFLTLYLQNVRGYSAIESGVRTLPMTLMVMLIAPIAGKLSARIGPRPLMVGGMLVMSLGLASLDPALARRVVLDGDLPVLHLRRRGRLDVDAHDHGRRHGLGRSGARRHRLRRRQLRTAGRRRTRRGGARLDRGHRRLLALGRQRPGGPAGQCQPLRFARDRRAGRPDQPASPGSDAGLAASQAFVDGVTTAMTVGSLLALTGAVIAFFGLRGFRPVAAPQGQAAPIVAVEA